MTPSPLQDRPLRIYLWLAFGITWASGGLGLLVGAFRSEAAPPRLHPLHYLAAFGPSIAGIIMAASTDGWGGVRRLFARVIPRWAHVPWYGRSRWPRDFFSLVNRSSPSHFDVARRDCSCYSFVFCFSQIARIWPRSSCPLDSMDRGKSMARVTGIGGIFFKSKGESAPLAEWYRKHLGVQLEPFGGAIFRWPDDTGEDRGLTVWHVAGATSRWFQPSEASFMINYRVDDLDQMLTNLRADGVEVVGGPESHENGKFAWILDPDGNKLELWEPRLWDEKNKGA